MPSLRMGMPKGGGVVLWSQKIEQNGRNWDRACEICGVVSSLNLRKLLSPRGRGTNDQGVAWRLG